MTLGGVDQQLYGVFERLLREKEFLCLTVLMSK
jgi:hypothetical protein